MKFLLVSNSPIQNSYFEKFLRDNNFEFKSICGETVSPYNKKNASNLDFFSMNDHAELLTTRQWIDTIDSLQACAATNEDSNPDLTPFVGWEWTQQGSNAFNHFGHKNVIFKSSFDLILFFPSSRDICLIKEVRAHLVIP